MVGHVEEGDMGVHGNAVIEFSFQAVLRYCGISSPAVCSFASFWLTVFGKRRSFTV